MNCKHLLTNLTPEKREGKSGMELSHQRMEKQPPGAKAEEGGQLRAVRGDRKRRSCRCSNPSLTPVPGAALRPLSTPAPLWRPVGNSPAGARRGLLEILPGPALQVCPPGQLPEHSPGLIPTRQKTLYEPLAGPGEGCRCQVDSDVPECKRPGPPVPSDPSPTEHTCF